MFSHYIGTSQFICIAIKWLVSIWWGTLVVNGLSSFCILLMKYTCNMSIFFLHLYKNNQQGLNHKVDGQKFTEISSRLQVLNKRIKRMFELIFRTPWVVSSKHKKIRCIYQVNFPWFSIAVWVLSWRKVHWTFLMAT